MKKRKYGLVALLLALVLALSGCNLIEVDVKMQAEEDMARVRKAHAAPVATYLGGEVTAAEVLGDFNAIYNELYYTYINYFGYEMGGDEIIQLMQDVIFDHVRMEISADHFDVDHSLSDADLARVEADARSQHEMLMNEALSVADGEREEDRQAQAELALLQSGMDYESLYANLLLSMKNDRMQELLRAEVDEVSEEELRAVYEERVLEDEENYAAEEDGFGAASGDAAVCWMPAGYRRVKHILLAPDAELQDAYIEAVYAVEDMEYEVYFLEEQLADARDDDSEEGPEVSEEELRAEIAGLEAVIAELEQEAEAAARACLDSVKPQTDEIYARLEAGEDFEALMDEFGTDPEMRADSPRRDRCYVSAASDEWPAAFRSEAMSLMHAGDWSAEPVVSESGVHIIRYEADVPAGAVPFEDVRDLLLEETLELARDEYCETTISSWVAERQPLYDVDVLVKLFTQE